jgi:hypothetical protein
MNYTSSRNCFHIKIHFLNGFIGFIITAWTAHIKTEKCRGVWYKNPKTQGAICRTAG